MTLVGTCHICSAPAMNTCRSCGRLVCRAHYIVERGVCESCTGTQAKPLTRGGHSDEGIDLLK